HGDSQPADAVDSGPPVENHAQRAPGPALSRGPGCTGRLNSNLQARTRAARWLRLGRDRKRPVAGDFSVRNLLLALLHWPGRTAAGSYKRAAVLATPPGRAFALSAAALLQFCRSL